MTKQTRTNTPKRKKYAFQGLLLLLLLVGFLCSPLVFFVRSLLVMGVYSGIHKKSSAVLQEHIDLHIPGGLGTAAADWYPFSMVFVADAAYARYTGEQDAKLTIFYNFPAFSYAKGCSRLFDPDSLYYNGFYGAYILQDSSNRSLAQGQLDENVAASVARFDFFYLVLGDFGLSAADEVFDFAVRERTEGVKYAGHDGWTRLELDITVNGSAHNARKGVTSYLQYGHPNFGAVAEEFAPVNISGRIYARYFPEADASVYFYVMGQEEACQRCDDDILSQSRLRIKKPRDDMREASDCQQSPLIPSGGQSFPQGKRFIIASNSAP